LPIDGPAAELSTDGVLVDIVEGMLDHVCCEDVPIISGALLPESKTGLARPFANHEFLQKW